MLPLLGRAMSDMIGIHCAGRLLLGWACQFPDNLGGRMTQVVSSVRVINTQMLLIRNA